MRKILALTLLVLLTGALASAADDFPRVETFLGYTYARINSSTDVPSFSANGGGGQVAVNINKWIGFVGDIASVHNGNIEDLQLDTTMTNFLFGPRISIRTSRVTPYFNVLFGAVHASTSGQLNVTLPPTAVPPIYIPGMPTAPTAGQQVSLRAVHAQNAFAFALGGGLELKINKHVAFRPIGLDYFMTRLQNLRLQENKNQDHIRVQTGITFRFGAD
jgi:opacity protein-like surface antigen